MEVSGQLHAPTAFSPGKEPTGTHCIVGQRTSVDAVERNFLPRGEINPDSSVTVPTLNYQQ
jgi:hypothetical protein